MEGGLARSDDGTSYRCPFSLGVGVQGGLRVVYCDYSRFEDSFKFFRVVFCTFFGTYSVSTVVSSAFSVPAREQVVPNSAPTSTDYSSFV